MNKQEIMQLINQLKQQFKSKHPNMSDEDIEHMVLKLFFQMFCEDKMDRQDLTALTRALGYNVNDNVLDQIEQDKRGGK